MKKIGVLLTLGLLGMLALSASVSAQVPSMMTYQGRLTDDVGAPLPNEPVNVTFRIYDQLSTQRWIESHVISPTDGLFSVQLGSNGSPLTEDLLTYDECWLGVTVGGDPELTPRARLITVPYAFRVGTVDGAEGGTITSDVTVLGTMELGTPSQNGGLYVYLDGSTKPIIAADRYSTIGGQVDIFDESGNAIIALEADADGEGAFLQVDGGSGSQFFRVDGNQAGTGNPGVTIQGTVSDTYFNTDASGDGSIEFPTSAVNSTEMFNEPGIASEASDPASSLTNTGMTDIETVTITIPSAGYIVVQGKCNARTSGSTSINYMYFQIDETAGGNVTSPYYEIVGQSTYANSNYHYFPVAVQRVYFKTAGTYTFRLEGIPSSGSHSSRAFRASVIAQYFPTSYESIKSFVSNPAGFESAVPVEMLLDDDNPSVTETMYEVDLRELELRAARLRAATLEAEKALRDAQSQQGLEVEHN